MTLFGTQCLYIEVCDWEIAKESLPLGPRFQLISSLALSKSKRRENDVFYKLKRKELALFIVLKFYGNFLEGIAINVVSLRKQLFCALSIINQ